MAERQESGKEGISDKRETHLAVLSLFGSALIWGLICIPIGFCAMPGFTASSRLR